MPDNSGSVSMRVRAQRFGGKLSAMVLPNLGAFMGWGIITALAIWLKNDMLNSFITPTLTYLLPILIGYAGGKLVYGDKGGVIGAFATMGVILGAEISMLLGAMIISPLAAWVLKKVDKFIEPHIPVGFELLIGNLTIAILGAIIAVLGMNFLAPAITSLSGVFAAGVSFLQENALLPLTAIFIEPAKVLFLNNAIGQGILTPLGTTQLNEFGKSILFLLESNPGPGLGILLAYCVFGRGNARANAYGATLIHAIGGIHEIYFPFILMRPALVIAAIAGGITGTAVFSLFNVGLVGVSSPGSIITIMMMASAGDHLFILLGIAAAAAVSFIVASVILKGGKQKDVEDENREMREAAKQMESLKGKRSRVSSVFEDGSEAEEIADMVEAVDGAEGDLDYASITRILYVCDAGMGSSAMGASVVAKKLKKAGVEGIEVPHAKVVDLPDGEADVIITHSSLADVVRERQPDIRIITIEDYLNAPEYDELIQAIVDARK